MGPCARLSIFPASAALAVLTAWLPAQDVSISHSMLPAEPKPGGTALVIASFERDASVEEKRLVFVFEVCDAANGEVLYTRTVDNSGNGYTAQSGTFNFPFPVPQDTEAIHFNIHASPWSLNRWVVEKFRSYPTDGTWTYEWPGGGFGVTQDIYYLGALIAPKPPNDTTYCSGIAFEVGVLSHLEYNALYGHPTIGGMDVTQMSRFRHMWYGTRVHEPDPQLKLAALAIPSYGIGLEIIDFEEVQEGDFVQFWRNSGSGHNPLFVRWLRNPSGDIVGMEYWGSQGSTNGLGFRTEFFGTSGSSIDRARTFFGRIRKPRDQGDVDFALTTYSTADNPVVLIPPQVMLNGVAVY